MAERVLVIDAHPDPDRARLCHALAEAYVEGARATGKEARLIALAEAELPMLRSAAEFARAPDAPAIVNAREDIVRADHLVLVFPLWLGGAPALLHVFLEQIARGNFFAETSGAGIRQRLKGKSARLIVTMGMPSSIYQFVFCAHGMKSIARSVLGFAGFTPVRMTLFGMAEAASAAKQKRRLAQVAALGREGR